MVLVVGRGDRTQRGLIAVRLLPLLGAVSSDALLDLSAPRDALSFVGLTVDLVGDALRHSVIEGVCAGMRPRVRRLRRLLLELIRTSCGSCSRGGDLLWIF